MCSEYKTKRKIIFDFENEKRPNRWNNIKVFHKFDAPYNKQLYVRTLNLSLILTSRLRIRLPQCSFFRSTDLVLDNLGK